MLRTLIAQMATTVLLLLCGVSGGQAGPMQDFEREVRMAYADYRIALFRTNTNDKAASAAAIDAMATKWQTLAVRWIPAPPPQYGEDRLFKTTLESVANILVTAGEQTAAAQLGAAHETLEKFGMNLPPCAAGMESGFFPTG